MSFKLEPRSTTSPPRVRENDCDPIPMSIVNALAPAWASKDLLLPPEVTSTVPALVKNATTKIESATPSAPLGTPSK